MKKFLLLAVIGLIGFTSCKKDDPVIPEKTRKDYLTASDWKYKTINNGLSDCDSDDILTFTTDGNFTINFGSNLCNTNETRLEGTWSLFDEDSKVLKEYTAFGNTLRDTLNIVKLNETTFEYIDENHNNIVLQH